MNRTTAPTIEELLALRDAQLAAIAARHAGGRLVSMLEGGYSLAALRACSVAHLHGLAGATPA